MKVLKDFSTPTRRFFAGQEPEPLPAEIGGDAYVAQLIDAGYLQADRPTKKAAVPAAEPTQET